MTILLALLSAPVLAADMSGPTAYIAKLKAAAEAGDAEAQNDLGSAYLIGGGGMPRDYVEAAKWWQHAADQGNPKAQANLGSMYSQGMGVPKNSTEAVKWWNKAAEKHNGDAMDQLGFAYLLGDGVPKSYTYAYMWFNLAASSGDKHAVKDRDSIAKYMAAEQIAEAQRIMEEWAQKHP